MTWVERFTPDAGGSPTDTARSYIWDGSTPGGYNPSDNTTWPKTPVYEVDAPNSNGTVTLALLAYTCIAAT